MKLIRQATFIAALAMVLASTACIQPIGQSNHTLQRRVAERENISESSKQTESSKTAKRWHLDLVLRNAYPRLKSTKRQLDRRLDLPLKFDVTRLLKSPHSPIDLRTDMLLITSYAGLGRQESDWLTWTAYLGWGAGEDHTHQRVLNSNLEVEFRYGYFYSGLTFELYPWKLPPPLEEGSEINLEHGRPFIHTGFEVGYVSGSGRGHYSLAPVRIYEDKVTVRDWVFAYIIGLGWSQPITDHWYVQLAGDYKFHIYRAQEYSGWEVLTGLRYRF